MRDGQPRVGGSIQEKQLQDLLRGSETRLVGPNCAGLADTWSDLHATMETFPNRGRIAMVSQSGVLCSAFTSNMRTRGAGVSKYISLGNKVDVDETDLIELLGTTPLPIASLCIWKTSMAGAISGMWPWWFLCANRSWPDRYRCRGSSRIENIGLVRGNKKSALQLPFFFLLCSKSYRHDLYP